MTAALTGTPGVGKTVTSIQLRRFGYSVLDLNEFIEKFKLIGNKDVSRDTHEVDISRLREIYHQTEPVCHLVEGHLSHHLDLTPIIILRCSPKVLRERMTHKDWRQNKIDENLMVEILDVVLLESIAYTDEVYEIDTTDMIPSMMADAVRDILQGDTEPYIRGKIDWTSYIHEDIG